MNKKNVTIKKLLTESSNKYILKKKRKMNKEFFIQNEVKIKNYTIATMVLIIAYSLFGIYKVGENVENNTVVTEVGRLSTFRFLEYREHDGGAFFDIVNTTNGKKYKDVFISKSCPNGKNKKAGMLMKLSAQKHVNYSTQEEFYRFDRAYDYMCTKKDMEKEDTELAKKMKDSNEEMVKQSIKALEGSSAGNIVISPRK